MKLLGALLVAALVACAGAVKEPDYTARADEAVKQAFEGGDPKLVARVTQQDEIQSLCSKYRDVPPAAEAQPVMAAERAAIRYPASGRLMGDWRKGKAIAEDVAGMRFGDVSLDRIGHRRQCIALTIRVKRRLVRATDHFGHFLEPRS